MTARVAQVVGSLELGGAERVALELAAGLPARGLASELVTLARADEGEPLLAEAAERGVPVRRLELGSIRDAGARAHVLAYLRSEKPLIHGHNRPGDWQMVGLAALAGLPALYTRHLPYARVSAQQRLVYALAARRAAAVVAVSQPVCEHLLRVERAPAAKLHLIHNGIDTKRFSPASDGERRALRAELGVCDEDFLWLCAARLAPQKGHAFLLGAAARLPASSRARIHLAGSGPDADALQRLAAELELGDRVRFLGARGDVARLLNAADGYVCTSLSEGHPLSILEAFALGLPVVAPRLPSITSLDVDWGVSWFGPDHGDWAEAHDAGELAAAMERVEGQRPSADVARQRRDRVCERFSLDRMLDDHAALYERVLS